MRTKWYIYTRLQLNTHSQPTDHKKTSATRNTIQQEIMSVSPLHPTTSTKFHAIHANFAKQRLPSHTAPTFPPPLIQPTNQQAPFPSPHALQILPHTFLPANWIPFFAPYPSRSISFSLSIIASFLALVLGNKFLRSLTAFRFSWETDFQGSFLSCFSRFPLISLSLILYFLLVTFFFFCLSIRFLCQLQVLSKCK